jgi:hypothetical protein
MKYIQLDQNNYVQSVIISKVAPEGNTFIAVDDHLSPQFLQTAYLVDEVLTARPPAPALVLDQDIYSVDDCPVGTRITIADISNGELIAEVVTDANTANQQFQLVDEGQYQVEVTPPGPWLSETYQVEVT